MSAWGWNAPQQAWWLAVPLALIALYFFRPRHRPQRVAALFLWRRTGQALAGQSLWYRWQSHRLLWWQLLIALLLVAALMSPYQVRPGLLAQQVALLIDTSASMAAQLPGGPSRLESALQEARRMLDQAPRGCQFLLLALDKEVRLIQPLTQDRSLLRQGLGQLQVRALAGRDELLAPLGQSLSKAQVELHWFSDHPHPHLACIYHGSNQGSLNYAIESFQGDSQRVFVALKNYSSQPAEVRLRLGDGSGTLQPPRAVWLRGAGRQLVQLPLPAGAQPPFQLQLLADDHLALDNQAFCQPTREAAARLLVHGQPSLFLQQACQAASGATLIRQPVPGSSSPNDLHLWQRLPENWPHDQGLHLAAQAPASWLQPPAIQDQGLLVGQLGFPLRCRRWGERQRLRADLTGLRNLVVDQAGQPLVLERQGAMVWLFDPANSELPWSPELPRLLAAWLQDRTSQLAPPGGLLCGNRVELPPGELRGPRGAEVRQGREWSPTWPGLYRLGEQVLAVNFHAPEESQLRSPPPSSGAPPMAPPPTLVTRPMSQQWQVPLALLALVLLLGEYRMWWGSRPRC